MIRAAFALMLAGLCLHAYAGQACIQKTLGPSDVRAALSLAQDLADLLDRDQAQIAFVARVGEDLSRYGLRYSHVGIAWRGHPRGTWTMVEELNECGTARSALFDDGFGTFFLDDMYAYEAKIVVPSPTLQRRIAAVLAAGAAGRMHDPHYNLVAYPWNTEYQNSNQWLLETVAQGLAGKAIKTRAEAQAWLRQAGYRPTTLHLSPLERLGAELFSVNVAFDDHPLGRLLAGEVDVVSAESTLAFIQALDPGAVVQVISVRRHPVASACPPVATQGADRACGTGRRLGDNPRATPRPEAHTDQAAT
ncbi:MAG: DUF2145 domain-containing protein [Candidatus Levyibacteriota bacterium]